MGAARRRRGARALDPPRLSPGIARTCVRFAPGCYWIEPSGRNFLWIAANELPLCDELIPFLLARSGQPLDELGRWVAPRRSADWVLGMLEYLPMTTLTREDLLWRFGKSEDPEIEARRQHILRVLLECSPQTKQELIEQGRLEGQLEARLEATRAHLRRILDRRQLAPTRAEDARIEACTDLATLERWLDRAVTAPRVADALE